MKRQQIILASLGSLTAKRDEFWDKTLCLFSSSARYLRSGVHIQEITAIAYAMKEDLENV